MAEQLELFPQEESQSTESIQPTAKNIINDAEWCFQFFNNEPVVFGWQSEGGDPSPLVLQIQPVDGESLTFQQSGMNFRIFSREITEETKLERAKQKEFEDESKSKEITS